MSAPIGDYFLARYCIDCKQAEIRLHAEKPLADTDVCHATEIIFSGVEGHHFEFDNFGTILGHIVEIPLESFVGQRAGQFRDGWRQSGWPNFWRDSVVEAIAYLRGKSIRAFELTSACGMQGWVLARECKTQAANPLSVTTPPQFSPADETWMRRALELARQAEAAGEVPVGAVLARDGEAIAEGWNCPISTHDPTAHAEIISLRAGGLALNNYRLVGATLYVTLEPCAMCMAAIVHARVKRLVFGAYDPKRGAVCNALRLAEAEFLNHRVDWTGGVLEEECSALLRAFFRRRR